LDGGAGAGAEATLDLLARQQLFSKLLAELILYAYSRGYKLTLAEVGVQGSRRSRDGRTYEDGVHMRDSLHYARLAADLNLFVNDLFIRDSRSVAWQDLGSYWQTLHPLCRWGGTFTRADANHVSIAFMGKA
jgi:hypothetical protein